GRRGDAKAGLFRMRSRDVVPIRECPVQDEMGTTIAFAARDAVNRVGIEPWDDVHDVGILRSIVVRSTKTTKQAQVTLVARRTIPRLEKLVMDLERAGATGVAVNWNERPGPQLMGRETEGISGPARISEKIGGVSYLSSPGAFFQTSAWGAAFLVDAVRRLVDAPSNARVIDLYSGGGLLSLALADRVREVIGIEENRGAVGDAVASARANGFSNATFLAGRTEDRIRSLGGDRPPYAVVLDPPRDGCVPSVIDAVAGLKPERVVYVSCEPTALGRDLALFRARGWELERVEPLDMFPHAFHIEALAVLTPARRARVPGRRR
ncbi:MAG TPA: 23S rRNA (uracil(1939)-C(5))-methyltransferase RlmD, partial [bacterium]|nr:23S rRNA (uracil(1939)-C(5))-methyltransferase RlmD [bacterium]